jgi:ferredoxin-NADP reductase
MAFSIAVPWNSGEEFMHQLLRVPPQGNPTSAMLTPQASFMLQHAPLLAFGTLDKHSRPWATLWGGLPGFSEPLGGGLIVTRTPVDGKNDPVVQALMGDVEKGEEMHHQDGGKLFAGLAIDLMTRKRVKIAGRVVSWTVRDVDIDDKGGEGMKHEQIKLLAKVEQSLGNCPKYLNQYEISPAHTESKLVSQGSSLSPEAQALIASADMFFLSTRTKDDMDVNHRGGPPGFVRIISSWDCHVLIYPEYSGNRLYQSLGNLQLDSRIGVTFPNYETGDVLYITGFAGVCVGKEAAALLPGSNLAVRMKIEEARFVAKGLPFRGVKRGASPYNPLVRRLAAEGNTRPSSSAERKTARLIQKELLTPSVARFTFSVPEGIAYEPGQWIALDFKEELDLGYEHMRDEDPKSLNDDFVRTFTISSTPKPNDGVMKEFAITIRKIGPVTKHLFQQNDRAGFEVTILGIGGEFKIANNEHSVTPFIAGGVGITPLLPQLHNLDVSFGRFKLLWTLRGEDFGLVRDTFDRYPELIRCTEIFVTGDTTVNAMPANGAILHPEATVVGRRLLKSDVEGVEHTEKWYLCAGKGLKEQVLGWLGGKQVVFENFDY